MGTGTWRRWLPVLAVVLSDIFTAVRGYGEELDASGVPVARVGTADFGMLHPRWPCALARASEIDLPVLRKAILWNTFGNDQRCLKRYLEDPRLELLQIHLINEVCHRNEACGPYEFLAKMSRTEYELKLRRRDPELLARLSQYMDGPANLLAQFKGPQTACYVSPGLESNLSPDAGAVLIELVQTKFPQCRPVWNPWHESPRAARIPGAVFELHGSERSLTPPCIANLDGEDISFPSRRARLPDAIPSSRLGSYFRKMSACDAVFLWVPEMNGRGSPDIFIDPRRRTSFPSLSLFHMINRSLMSGIGASREKRLRPTPTVRRR